MQKSLEYPGFLPVGTLYAIFLINTFECTHLKMLNSASIRMPKKTVPNKNRKLWKRKVEISPCDKCDCDVKLEIMKKKL